MAPTTATKTEFTHLSKDDLDGRYLLVEAMSAAREARIAASRHSTEDIDAYLAAHAAADKAFHAHLSYKRSELFSDGYRRYDLAFDGTYFGWVASLDGGRTWGAWLSQRNSYEGRKITTDATRAGAAEDMICSLTIYGACHYGWA